MLRDHDHVLEYVDAYLHEVLSPLDAEIVEQHCDRCPVCKVALDEARKRFAALATVPTVEAPERLVRATIERITIEGPRRERFRRRAVWGALSALAASVLLLVGLNIHYSYLVPSPYEVVVLGQNQMLAAANASLRIRVIDHFTGAAIANVPVEVELRGKDRSVKLAQFKTDAAGTGAPSFTLPDWPDGDYELHVVAQTEGRPEVLTQPIKFKRSWKLMLSSDKPVYQPGQEIHVRSLALRKPDLRPVANQDATFSISDPKGNVIFKQQGKTSEFGIAHVDCPLATELIEGPYAIVCKVGDTESKLTVEVKKYVLPKFKIDVARLDPYYRPGQEVKGTVSAAYHFGKPVAGGEVKIKVAIDGQDPKNDRELTLKTDDEGKAEFDFTLPENAIGREMYEGDGRFRLDVTVTDAAGQKHQKFVVRSITRHPLRLDVIPESGSLVQGVANKVYLFAATPDGQPARVRLRVSGAGTPQDLTTSALGVASFDVTPMQPNVALAVDATDEQGARTRRHIQLQCGGFNQDFLVRTDRAVYDSGQTMHLVALGGGVEPVFIDFIKDGQTVLTHTLPMANGRGEYDLDLPPELFGTIELNAYRFPPPTQPASPHRVNEMAWQPGNVGQPVRKSRVLYVRPASQVTISAEPDRKQYLPRDKAKLVFKLTDAEGRPVRGALSLSAVDEAVYSVLDRAPGMEGVFYTLDQELMQPVYTIYPNWGPAAQDKPNEERVQLEKALFSRTARASSIGGGMDPRRAEGVSLPASGDERGIARAQPAPAAPSPYSLAAGSFSIKLLDVRETRNAGLKWVVRGWVTLLVLSLIAGYAALWAFAGRTVLIATHFMGLALFMGAVGAAFLTSQLASRKSDGWAMDAPAAMRMESAGGSARVGVSPSAMDPEDGDPRKTFEPPPLADDKPRDGGPVVRVRDWFPETLMWQPQLVTDEQGRATYDVDLADSITDWRLTTSAVTADGRLGALQSSIRVFQPFFVDLDLPVALTRNDEVELRVPVHNYHDEAQTVEVALKPAPWFTLLDKSNVKSIALEPRKSKGRGNVRAVTFKVRVDKVGKQQLEVTGTSGTIADGIKRDIEVIPDGRRLERVFNGNLQQPANLALSLPEEAIEGSPRAILKIYPSNFSQLVEGLEAIFRMPSGCFEQTSSTTYPNVLALDYLRRTGKSVPRVEAKAKQYIHLGYQKLLTFEVSGGGFDWFGRGPANRTLTAYGLMEFTDMAKVHDVDPKLIARTRHWLLKQQQADGSWLPEAHYIHEDPTRRGSAELSTTAYIAWAVFTGHAADVKAAATKQYLLKHAPNSIADPYTLALVCNALAALDTRAAAPYLERLEALKRSSDDGKRVWWAQDDNGRTAFHGSGRGASIETTALATLALLPTDRHPATCRGALAWLAQQKDAAGTWHSTQATVLALKALLASADAPFAGDRERRIEVTFGKHKMETLVIKPDQADVMLQRDLSNLLASGDQTVKLTEPSGSGVSYSLAFRYHLPGAAPVANEPLTIAVDYDKTDLAVDDTVLATAAVMNRMKQAAPMVMLDLPIPPGFALDPGELAELVGRKKIARYQLTGRQAIVYLTGLQPGEKLVLNYTLRATMPVKVTSPAARVYEYYDPDKQGFSKATQLTVTPR